MRTKMPAVRSDCSSLPLSRHAELRMQQRGIRASDVAQALRFGRRIHSKGLTFYVVGRKEVAREARAGQDISKLSGLQVLVEADGLVVTTYRSSDFHAIRAAPRWKQGSCSSPKH